MLRAKAAKMPLYSRPRGRGGVRESVERSKAVKIRQYSRRPCSAARENAERDQTLRKCDSMPQGRRTTILRVQKLLKSDRMPEHRAVAACENGVRDQTR